MRKAGLLRIEIPLYAHKPIKRVYDCVDRVYSNRLVYFFNLNWFIPIESKKAESKMSQDEYVIDFDIIEFVTKVRRCVVKCM